MVFESLITDLLNKYLGDYIENLDKSQLKLSLWGGDVKLENLDIKANAFDDLDLPIRVMQGHLGLLTLKIPWKHLYTEPWIVELDGLYVLAVPNMAIKYNEEKDMKYQFESKMKELRKIEEAKQRKAEAKGAKDEEKDSFGLKLGMQILKNLQMRIRNIHIRYEDAFSNPSRPHSTGITLHNLSLQTTDSSWNPCTIKDNVKNFHKLIQLDCLALYWNSKTKMYNDMKRGLLKNTMKSHIASPDNPKVTDYNHIIRPISSTGKLIINMKPEQTAFSEPMFWVDLIMNEMKFALSRSQYIDITSTLSGVNRMVTQSKYLKYRPEQELNKSSKETLRLWWKFAYNVVLHETVRRRRRMWSWNHMKNHRALCKQYIEVYARQLQGKSLYAEEKKMVVEAEHNLDVFNLTLCRQRAELQHLRTKQAPTKKSKKKMKKHEREKKGGGWFSGWWGGSKAAAEGQDKDRKSLTEKFEAEMTSEEKMKLYSVLDYEEHGVEAIDYPKDFVLTTVRFQLFKFGFSLYDEELPHPRIMKTSVNALFTSINMRPVNDGISVSVTVDSMVVLGCKQDEGMAKLVSSQLIDPGGSEGEGESANLLKISFEQHPLSGDCDNRIQVNARPLEIIYDAATINHIAKFFQAPDDVRLDELSSAVMNSLEEMKEMTATGLKYLAQKRMYTDIHVDIKPSYFILPDTGVFKKGCRMLLVDLGSVCVDSERPAELDEKEILSGESMDFDKVKERAYDLFNVTLQSMQVLYIDKGEDWQSIRKKSESKSHILRPFGFHVLLKKCIIATDIRLPNFVITGDLPILALDVSGFILKNVIEIMLHIPWPENKKSEEMTEEEKKILTILKNQGDLRGGKEMSAGQIMRAVKLDSTSSEESDEFETSSQTDENEDALEQLPEQEKVKRQRVDRATRQMANLVKVDILFVIRTIILRVNERVEATGDEKCLLSLSAESIGMSVTQRKFDLEVQAYVGSIQLKHMQIINEDTGEHICILKTRKHREAEKLMYVKVVLAERRAPNFFEAYGGIRKKILAQFKTLEVCLHQEAVLSLMDISDNLILSLTPESSQPERPKEIWEDVDEIKPAWNQGKSIAGKINHMRNRREAKIQERISGGKMSEKVQVQGLEVKEIAVEAILESFLLKICSQRHRIAEVAVKGLRADIQLDSRATEVSATLADLSVKDESAGALYRTVCWIEEHTDLFSMQLIIFNDKTSKPTNQFNLNKIDMAVNVSVGQLNLIFLYSFISRLLAYFKNFQTLLEQAKGGAQKLSEKAVTKISQSVKTFEIQPRVGIDMDVSAPVIYIPKNSHSSTALMLDLGHLCFNNKFELDQTKGTDRENTAIIEKSLIILDNLKLSRAELAKVDAVETVDSSKDILQPITVEAKLTRNLSEAYYFDLPSIETTAKMNSVKLAMTQGDYNIILKVLTENLEEDNSDTITISKPKASSVVDKTKASSEGKKRDTVTVKKEEEKKEEKADEKEQKQKAPSVYFKYNFVMHSVVIELIKGDPAVNNWNNLDVKSKNQFAQFMIAKLTVDGYMKTEGSINLKSQISDCTLLDTRPTAENRITKMLESKDKDKPMLDLSFEQDAEQNMKVEVEMCRFYMCACTDYLMSIADFFVKGLEGAKPKVEEKKAITTEEKKDKKQQKKSNQGQPSPFTIDFRGILNEPEIILVENADTLDTNVIILKLKANCRYWLTHDQEITEATVDGLQVIFCPYIVEKRKNRSLQILAPCYFGFNSSKPLVELGMHGNLMVSDIVVRITPTIIQSITRITSGLSRTSEEDAEQGQGQVTTVDDDFWHAKAIDRTEYYFLNSVMGSNQGESEVEEACDVIEVVNELEAARDDEIFFKVDNIVFVLEMDVKNKNVPVLIAESRLEGEMRNWTRNMSLICSPTISMFYYNNKQNVWEPLIEPLEVGMNTYKPWDCTVNVTMNTEEDLFADEVDETDTLNLAPSKMVVNVSATDTLELTLSKVALDVLKRLGNAFTEAYYQRESTVQRDIGSSPVLMVNYTGIDVHLILDDTYEWPQDSPNVSLESGSTLRLELSAKISANTSSQKRLSERSNSLGAEEALKMVVAIDNTQPSTRREISIKRTETRAFDINKKTYPGVKWQLLADITVYLGIRTITLRSVLQLENLTSVDLEVQYYNEQSRLVTLTQLAAGDTFNVPMEAVYSVQGEFAFRPVDGGYAISSTTATWRPKKESQPQRLTCLHENGSRFYLNVNLVKTPIYYDHTDEKRAFLYNLTVSSPMSLHNHLPMPVEYYIPTKGEKVQYIIEPGTRDPIYRVGAEHDSIEMNLDYMQKEWFASLHPSQIGDEELTVLVFESTDGYKKITLDLGIRQSNVNGLRSFVLYSPYWMINKTGLSLTYRNSDDEQSHHPSDMKEPILFSFRARSIFGKKKAAVDTEQNQTYLKVGDSQWSDRFSLDTVGNWGRVTCKSTTQSFDVGVRISLSTSGLTKIVTFIPYFMIVNNSNLSLACKELSNGSEWVTVPPGEAVPFWPLVVGPKMLMRCRVKDNSLTTQPFPFHDSHSVLMKLDKLYGGLFVEVQCSEEATVIAFENYVQGMSPALIINDLEYEPLYYQQSGSNVTQKLEPGHEIQYAWENVLIKRELTWSCGEKKKGVTTLTSDGLGDFKLHPINQQDKVFWVSFVHDMQRILLFTSSPEVAKKARFAHDLEQFEQEITLSIPSIGLSLVDNDYRQEISYISIAKSGVKWHEQKKGRLRPLKLSLSNQIEGLFQEVKRDVEIEGNTKNVRRVAGAIEIDFSSRPTKMLKPNKADLYRFSEPGLYLQYKASEHTMSLHLRVYRVQVDAQVSDAVFPVVFAPYAQPKSMAGDAGPKPLVEMSVVIDRASRSKALHVKYLRVLIQEMDLKLDHGYINGMLDLFSASVSDKNELEAFKADLRIIEERLVEIKMISEIVQSGRKNVYDDLHISPIKMHVSFSLASGPKDDKKTALKSDVLNLFLQSIGVTLTGVQDVVFKLGYFEKNNSLLTQKQLLSEVTRHYVNQGVKQMYVLVLGLDVIGNPFGVIRGIAKGVEDLFYEPVQGAIQGPEEFAEGVALGVRSLLGHAVGGAAGAVSRITGTLGKGIAALTLDDEYQRRRREQFAKRPETVQAGLAQGGRGLVMGVFHGVTGIVTKPVEGAKKDGVEGFFKGVGKGLVGVVVRPVSGVVDFASTSFEGIRKATDSSQEALPMRPPRYIGKDGVLKPYARVEAEGICIMRKVEKGRFMDTDRYIAHAPSKSGKQILILTDKQAILAERSDLMGSWSLEWNFSYSDLAELPKCTSKGVVITTKEKQKKLFGSAYVSKLVEMDSAVAQWLIKVLNQEIKPEDVPGLSQEDTATSSSEKSKK